MRRAKDSGLNLALCPRILEARTFSSCRLLMRKYLYPLAIALTLVASMTQATSEFKQGQAIAFDQTRGNCLACHAIADGESPGNIGPALSNMKARYPDISVLRARIWDETAFNPETVMPPFGRHRILSEAEIDLVLEFLYTPRHLSRHVIYPRHCSLYSVTKRRRKANILRSRHRKLPRMVL